MIRAVMVGGPLHGQTRGFPEDRLPHRVDVPRPPMPTFESEPARLFDVTDLPCRYELRWYQGWASWPPLGPATRQPAYLCMEKPARRKIHQIDEDEAYRQYIADDLWFAAEEAALPPCVVAGCTDKGRLTFAAAERGRLAGREWQRGDEIRLCPGHGSDVYRAQGARGMDQLAEWLRPDATWDPLDTYDGGTDLPYGAAIPERTARMLRLAIPARSES